MMLPLILFVASLPNCPKLNQGMWVPGACTETPARIKLGKDSYAKADLYCKVSPKGTAYWYDHTYTHTWQHRACKDFLKTYKAAK